MLVRVSCGDTLGSLTKHKKGRVSMTDERGTKPPCLHFDEVGCGLNLCSQQHLATWI